MLMMICESTALTRVVNCGNGRGLDAWRALMRYHEPKSMSRHTGLLQVLLNYSFDGDLSMRLDQFERDLKTYQDSSGDKVSDSMKLGVLIKGLPKSELKTHLLLNFDKTKDWTLMRQMRRVPISHVRSERRIIAQQSTRFTHIL